MTVQTTKAHSRSGWVGLLIVAAVAVTCLGLAQIAQAASVTGPIVGIAGKCLDNTGGSLADGNLTTLHSCNNTTEQQWTLPGDGTIRNQNHCLAVQHAGTTPQTPVWLYTCDGGPAQTWTVQANGEIVNPNSGLCLADSHAVTTDGNPIWVYTCDGGPAQIWTVPTSVDPSGVNMPVGDQPGWHQVFADNFATNVPLGSFPNAVSSKWSTPYDGTHDTSKNGTYSGPKTISVSSGMMNMFLHTEYDAKGNPIHYTSAPQPHIGYSDDSMKYGKYVVRFRVPQPIPGYKTAWLLWDDHCANPWPACGEVDFPEGNLSAGSTITANMHRWGAASGNDQDHFDFPQTYSSWHTATMTWTPTSIVFDVDGTTHTSTSRLPQDPMRYIMQTETQITGGAPANNVSGNVQVDWVAIYAKS